MVQTGSGTYRRNRKHIRPSHLPVAQHAVQNVPERMASPPIPPPRCINPPRPKTPPLPMPRISKQPQSPQPTPIAPSTPVKTAKASFQSTPRISPTARHTFTPKKILTPKSVASDTMMKTPYVTQDVNNSAVNIRNIQLPVRKLS